MRAYIFSLPVPPNPMKERGGYGRAYPTHTILGRLMRLRGLMIRDVCEWDGAPSDRTMTEYLAGRVGITKRHRGVLAKGLGVDARVL